MRLKENFVLRQIAETWVVLPLAEETVNFSGMLTLNESGAMLWKLLEAGADRSTLIQTLTSEYTVSAEQAKNDVDEYLNKLIGAGCVVAD